MWKYQPIVRSNQGFSLIELMIAVAIMGILALTASPTFIAYRNKSRVSAVVGTSESIRTALASYAANHINTLYPDSNSIQSLGMLQPILSAHGTSLGNNNTFTFHHYTRFDSDADGEEDSYSMRIAVTGVPNSFQGFQVLITPEGIFRCTASLTPC